MTACTVQGMARVRSGQACPCPVVSGRSVRRGSGVTLYGLTLLAIRLLGSALDGYARRAHLYSPRGVEVHSDQRKLLPVVIGYVIAILIGLALPELAVALYFGLTVYLIVPFREAARLLSRRS